MQLREEQVIALHSLEKYRLNKGLVVLKEVIEDQIWESLNKLKKKKNDI